MISHPEKTRFLRIPTLCLVQTVDFSSQNEHRCKCRSNLDCTFKLGIKLFLYQYCVTNGNSTEWFRHVDRSSWQKLLQQHTRAIKAVIPQGKWIRTRTTDSFRVKKKHWRSTKWFPEATPSSHYPTVVSEEKSQKCDYLGKQPTNLPTIETWAEVEYFQVLLKRGLYNSTQPESSL